VTLAPLWFRGEVSHDDILRLLQKVAQHKRVRLLEYSIGRERHVFPSVPQRDEHYHTYCCFSDRIEITDRRHLTLFDLRGHYDRVLHPEIQAVGAQPTDRQRYVNYTGKEGLVRRTSGLRVTLRSFS